MTRPSVQPQRHPGGPPAARPLADFPTPELRAAARHALAALRAGAPPRLDEATATQELLRLARAVHEPDHPPPPAPTAATPETRRALLDLLRAGLLHLWRHSANPPAPATMLATLEACETVRAHLLADPAEQLAAHLRGPDGLQLFIEIAHDLRSPLTSILFLAETLRRGQSGEINDVQRRQLGIIYSAALGLISIASDAMELARGSDRLAEHAPAPFSIAETLEAVRDIVQPMADEKGLAIRLLTPASDRRLGHGVALSRVLLNLTANALKSTAAGFVEITARARDRHLVEFAVRDTGSGIDPDTLAHLYQPFRPDPGGRRHAFSGAGLGLVICRRLVEAMGGALQVETRTGWGTRFFFELCLPPAPGP